MPCEEQVVKFLTELDPDAAVGNFLDPKRYAWSTRCYVPKTTSWLWGDKDDRSKSKCMCVLVDNTLTAEATQDAETQMCSYTPMEVDEAAVLAVLPYGERSLTVVRGGMAIPGGCGADAQGDIIMANAAAIVSLNVRDYLEATGKSGANPARPS